MLSFWGIVTALCYGGGLPAVAGLWITERRRSGRRNRAGQCAHCACSLESTASCDLYLIHGRLVCETCAEKARRRMPWHFGAISVATLSAATGVAVAQGGGLVLFPVAVTAAMTVGAVQVMKRANRRAQRRLVAGEPAGGERLADGDRGVALLTGDVR